jgi:hypothetical protein
VRAVGRQWTGEPRDHAAGSRLTFGGPTSTASISRKIKPGRLGRYLTSCYARPNAIALLTQWQSASRCRYFAVLAVASISIICRVKPAP